MPQFKHNHKRSKTHNNCTMKCRKLDEITLKVIWNFPINPNIQDYWTLRVNKDNGKTYDRTFNSSIKSMNIDISEQCSYQFILLHDAGEVFKLPYTKISNLVHLDPINFQYYIDQNAYYANSHPYFSSNMSDDYSPPIIGGSYPDDIVSGQGIS